MEKIRNVITWVLGIVLLVMAAYLFWSTKLFISRAMVTQGVVVENVRNYSDDSYTYSPVIQFNTEDGRNVEFKSKMGSSSPTYSVGEKVEIFYEPNEPEHAKINSFMSLYFFPTILGVMGGVMILGKLAMMLFRRLGKKKETDLLQQGRPVQAKVQGIEKSTSLNMNGRNSYHIIAHWRDASSNALHVFKSKNIWFNPEDYIDREEVTVYVDKSNVKKYHMDISFLPKVAD